MVLFQLSLNSDMALQDIRCINIIKFHTRVLNYCSGKIVFLSFSIITSAPLPSFWGLCSLMLNWASVSLTCYSFCRACCVVKQHTMSTLSPWRCFGSCISMRDSALALWSVNLLLSEPSSWRYTRSFSLFLSTLIAAPTEGHGFLSMTSCSFMLQLLYEVLIMKLCAN